jgi:hypothetical protein
MEYIVTNLCGCLVCGRISYIIALAQRVAASSKNEREVNNCYWSLVIRSFIYNQQEKEEETKLRRKKKSKRNEGNNGGL